MNNKRCFLLVLVLLFVVFPATACQEEPEIPTVGIINGLDLFGESTLEGFKTGMAELGYVEGDTIIYNIQSFALGEDEQIAATAQEMVAQPVDLIFAIGTPAVAAAQQATAESKIPVIFGSVNDPVGAGLIDNLRQPGGNMTGVTGGVVAADSDGRRLEWLKKINPDLREIYMTHDPNDAGMIRNLEIVQAAAAELDINVVVDVLSSQAEVDAAMADLPEDMEAFFPLADRRLIPHLPAIIAQSLERKFMFSTVSLDLTRAGALMAFAPDFGEIGQQSARLADQVLKGADPGTLPVEEPEILLNVNLKTAEVIGIEIPDEVLEASYEIIR